MTRPHHHEPELVNSAPPIEIKRSTKIAAPISLIIAFTGAVAVAYAAWDSLKITSASHEDRIAKLEQAQAAIAQNVQDTKNNVEWMRRIMEGKYSTAVAPSSNPSNHP